MKTELTKLTVFSIVLNEWREKYDREWGLGMVITPIQDGHCWVAKIIEDSDGYFVIPEVVYRSVKRLRNTNKTIAEVSISFVVEKG